MSADGPATGVLPPTSAESRARQLLAELVAIETGPVDALDLAMRVRPAEIEREAADLGDIGLWLPVTVSIGSATSASVAEPTQPGMLAAADRNLYAAKHVGRDRVMADRQLPVDAGSPST